MNTEALMIFGKIVAWIILAFLTLNSAVSVLIVVTTKGAHLTTWFYYKFLFIFATIGFLVATCGVSG